MDQALEQRFKNVSRSKTFSNIVRTYSLDTKAVLDIGCSYGEFLAHFGRGSLGITITEEEVVYGKTKGLDIRYGNIEADDFTITKKFDAIFANNIFEHLYSPHAFLRRAAKYLNEDGVLILGVPCIPTLSFLMRFKKFRGSLAVAHINFFTRKTLTLTVKKGGWRVLAMRGFRIKNATLDRLLNPIYPHFYVVAAPDSEFAYGQKRMKELKGYSNI